MFSRIQDLDRFKNDCKRFTLGIDSVEHDIKVEGQQLFDDLIDAVQAFDNATVGLVTQAGPVGHKDHATAQDTLQQAKELMEMWMLKNAPNIHVDEVAPKIEMEFLDK